MRFKRLKYYTVLGMLVILIAVSFGFSTFIVENPVNSSDGTETIDPPDIIPPDNSGSDEEIDSSLIPPLNKPFALINYAFDILNNGKGYTSTYYTEATSTVAGPFAGTQFIKTYRQRCGAINVETDYVRADTIGDNFARVLYVDNEKNEAKTLMANNYDYFNETAEWDSGTVKKYNGVEDFTNYYSMILNNYPVTINAGTAKCISSRISGKNYLLSFEITSFSDMYVNAFSNASDRIDHVTMKSMRITFLINRFSGYLVQAQRQETYDLHPAGLNVALPVVSSNTETFTKMNTEIILQIPDKLKQY